MARPTAPAAEANVDFDDGDRRFDRSAAVFPDFDLGACRFRPRVRAELLVDRFRGMRFDAARFTAPRFVFARVFAMHRLQGDSPPFRTDAQLSQGR
jgi:hypothetical protein